MKLVRKKSKQAHSDEKGLTLLETSIALCIMMVMTLATGSLFVYAVNYNSGAGDRSAALAIAQQRMERLRRAPYNDGSLSTPSTTETVIASGRTYTVVTTICTTSDCGGSTTLKIITVQVTPQNPNTWAAIPIVVTSQRATPTTGPYAGS